MIRRQLRRLLVVLGVIHLLDAILWATLWRYRHAVVRQLAEAAAELGRPGAGEGAPGAPPSSAGPRLQAPRRVT